ncbi:MAG: efflux RND transporter permease subunit [Candidatus Hydrogenedentes bacterium]|nr:efflux RND transporter permease subunit [Candidatus Hydrogenedentota bacterium]
MRRPVTVYVSVVAFMLASIIAVQRMPRDIFPDLGIPVIYVAQPYGGMDPAQMEGYISNYYEYHFLYVTGIEHVESKSIQGVALIKLQFHPGTNMSQAMAETVAQVNRSRAFMPPGTVPPFVTRFDAGSIPVGFLVFSSESRSLGEMQDLALNRVRPLFATLPGVSAPPPFGASQRSIVVRVDAERLRAYEMSPEEVVTAISQANTISPSGNVRIGDYIPMVPMNSIAQNVKDLEAVPIRTGSTQTVYLRDLGVVQDSSDIATGYALVNGRRTVFIPVTKRADASTMSVINLVKENMAKFQAVLPEDVSVSFEFDQSPYVTRAITGLISEGALGAVLTGFMVLLFLRDWRSSLIVIVTIPLSLLSAVFALWLTGQTVNLMTLGGLALAVGVLVDVATVVIENIHTHSHRLRKHSEHGERQEKLHLEHAQRVISARAALDATRETALPILLAMLCILAVFIPSFFMTGAGRALFVPLSLSVGFSMVAAYLLSSTLVPILAARMLRGNGHAGQGKFSFAAFQRAYASLLAVLVGARWVLVPAYLAASVALLAYFVPKLGTEIFPKVDMGQFQMRLRAPTGTRIEKTEQIALTALKTIENEVGAENLTISMGFVGIQPPSYPINTIYLWTGGPEEAVLQVALRHDAGISVDALKERLRELYAECLPDVQFSFEPSDIVSRVMSFGSPTPVEVAVSGPDLPANRRFAETLRASLRSVPTLRDLQIVQTADYPTVNIAVDRERAGTMGVTMTDVSRSVVAATSSSRFVTPVYWADPKSGVAYQVQVEIPQAQMNSVEEIKTITVARKHGEQLLLQDVADVTRGQTVGKYDRYNMQRIVTLTSNIGDTDLGRVATDVSGAIAAAGEPPPRVSVAVRGQIAPMEQMLGELQTGLLLAVVVILLLLAANFQSFILSFAVVSTVPAVLVGVVAALYVTGTTMNIQSFMGAIMAIGVSVANAILLVTFAERARVEGSATQQAAIHGATSRLRPILMTSFAMIAGMLPIALALGEGAEQSAPLGRAVIGGLAAATVATLLILPPVFAIVRRTKAASSVSIHPDDLRQSP